MNNYIDDMMLKSIRKTANANASELIGIVLRLCDVVERVSSERDKLAAELEAAKDAAIALDNMGQDMERYVSKLQDARERLVDLWHDVETDKHLHDFLGMTHEEYVRWVEGER